ncbi:Asparagine synthetase domain containing hypothetical protein [Phytophthora palmivora]|uniref:Asparagine synthetase domain-containing protein n=1 Tax=Phytophthora palmivora TaxID=4796 RepID=A0A2P4YFD4_9STRA|nr:Asparagine synthetase domain containing hypothetical protein [Phytophthora palmivora]
MTLEEMEKKDPVVEVLRQIRGPFALVWLHEKTKRMYFAHDRFGRRSLLYKRWGSENEKDMIAHLAGTEMKSMEFCETDFARFVLSNVAIGDNDEDLARYRELPASGIYVMDLKASNSESEGTKTLESSSRALLVALSNAVGVRIRSIPSRPSPNGVTAARVAVLFSGGLDSVVLAALSHFHAPPDEPIDLLTVCFDGNSGFASPDRLAAELAHAELCALFPERQWNLVNVNVQRTELLSKQHEVQTLMAPCDTHMDFNIGAAFWFLSRGRGDMKITAQDAGNATLEELNAFLKPQRGDLRELETEVAALSLFGDKNAEGSTLLCPVHRCGRKRKIGCVLGICKSCCLKMQRAVEKLVSGSDKECVDQREAQGYRAKLISMGMQSETHIDLLLDLLKTKQQKGRGEEANFTLEASISCRVHLVLVGIGADEQLAGYGRHRTTLVNGGEEAMRAELQMDLARIWKRNLGRDDRCIAAHGREARFPYLDENVVSTIATFPVSSLCDAELPRGVGDKRALRLVAKSLGLQSCAGLAKRAIQFGSRIAKVSNSGSNRQTQGMNKFSSVE